MEEHRTYYTIFRKEREGHHRDRTQPRLWTLSHIITTQDIAEIREMIGDEVAASLQRKLLFDCPSSTSLSEDFEYNQNIYVAAKSCVPSSQMYMYYHLQNGEEREDAELIRTCMNWKQVKEEFAEYADGIRRRRVVEGIYAAYQEVKQHLRLSYGQKRIQFIVGGMYADVTFYKVPLYKLVLT